MAVFGYVRVSTNIREDGGEWRQSFDSQIEALTGHPWNVPRENIITDRISGTRYQRPGLAELEERLQPGDTVLAFRLDRFGRNTAKTLEMLARWQERGITAKTIDGQLDMSSAGGRFVTSMIAASAQYERELTQERIVAGIQAARKNGEHWGRRHVLDEYTRQQIAADYQAGVSVKELRARHGNRVSRQTIYRIVWESEKSKKSRP